MIQTGMKISGQIYSLDSKTNGQTDKMQMNERSAGQMD